MQDTAHKDGSAPGIVLTRLALCGVMSLFSIVCVLWPAMWVVLQLAHACLGDGALADISIDLLPRAISSIGIALSIGILSVILAIPSLWWWSVVATQRSCRPGTRAIVGGLLVTPLLLPSYLAYYAWGLLRAPMTPVGDWLARQEPWVHVVSGRALAVAALALWAWPLATIVMASAARRAADECSSSLRLDARAHHAFLNLARMVAPAAWRAVLLVGVLMLGTAIPLHLAQMPTWSVDLWKAWDLTHRVETVWLHAWPLVIAAVVAGVLLIHSQPRTEAARQSSPTLRLAPPTVLCMLIWLTSVGLPLLLLALGVRGFSALTEFLSTNAEALRLSTGTALVTGLAISILTTTLWAGLTQESGDTWVHATCRWNALIFSIAGLLPGALVGAAFSAACSAFDFTSTLTEAEYVSLGIADLPVAPAVAGVHVARFGIVAALAGLLLVASEARELSDLRRLDGAFGIFAWVRTTEPHQWLTVLGAGIAGACLSFHEIESTVVVQPPGAGSLAGRLLEMLHYLREDDLAAGATVIVTGGVLLAVLAGVLLSRAVFGRSQSDQVA